MYRFAKVAYEAYKEYTVKAGSPHLIPNWDDLSPQSKGAYLAVANAILSTIKTGSE